uniref:Uncharacterized protein n=1 Tax=Moniliophthora roreri TaxID=221103 RepID=A0A0W0GAN2_MONRR
MSVNDPLKANQAAFNAQYYSDSAYDTSEEGNDVDDDNNDDNNNNNNNNSDNDDDDDVVDMYYMHVPDLDMSCLSVDDDDPLPPHFPLK